MRGYVDEKLCLACGLCAQACPEVRMAGGIIEA